MATVQLPTTPAFGNPRYYAPEPVLEVLRDLVSAPRLVLVIDVDTLDRSTGAKIDRVMTLALDVLARGGVQVVLVAHHEHDRATKLQRGITGSCCMPNGPTLVAHLRLRLPGARFIVVSNDRDLHATLGPDDRAIALGLPSLSSATVAVTGDTTVRAALWWLCEERARRLAR
jgi:hypothetical protein